MASHLPQGVTVTLKEVSYIKIVLIVPIYVLGYSNLTINNLITYYNIFLNEIHTRHESYESWGTPKI